MYGAEMAGSNPGCFGAFSVPGSVLENLAFREQKVLLPGFEPGLPDSESGVLTATL